MSEISAGLQEPLPWEVWRGSGWRGGEEEIAGERTLRSRARPPLVTHVHMFLADVVVLVRAFLSSPHRGNETPDASAGEAKRPVAHL